MFCMAGPILKCPQKILRASRRDEARRIYVNSGVGRCLILGGGGGGGRTFSVTYTCVHMRAHASFFSHVQSIIDIFEVKISA